MSSRFAVAVFIVLIGFTHVSTAADPPLPELTEPVNDFANVMDPASKTELDRLSRALKSASGDVLVAVTVQTYEPYPDITDYAVRLFENQGKGIGERGKENGVLIVLAIAERRVRIEVGYGLEPFITDGFAGETSRDYMAPQFRTGNYGAGVLAGATRIAMRIAQARGVQLDGFQAPPERVQGPVRIPIGAIIILVILFLVFTRGGMGGPRRGMRRWGRGG